MKTLINKVFDYAKVHGSASVLIYPVLIIVGIMASL